MQQKQQKTINQTLALPNHLSGQRLDRAMAQLLPEHSRSLLKQWLKQGHIQVDGAIVTKPSRLVQADSLIRISHAPLPEEPSWEAEPLALDIIHEAADFYIINKPAGIVTHPAPNSPSATLINGLLHLDPNLASVARCGLIHRLDKDTSGLLVVARNEQARTALTNQMKARQIKRHYLALVYGAVTQPETIDAPIGRHPKHRTKMAVVSEGKPAVTHCAPNTQFQGTTLLDVQLETGRTHQIRVHLAHKGHPLIGDPTYGARRSTKTVPGRAQWAISQFPRQALHATTLSLYHPDHGESLIWHAPLPNDFQALLAQLNMA